MTDKERRRELSDDELVAALVICNNRKGERCSSCPAFSKFGYPRACKRTVDLKVAELYKRIKRENTALREKAERENTKPLTADGMTEKICALSAERCIEVCLVAGCEGDSVCIADTRIAGPKAWGGGRVTYDWKTSLRDLGEALRGIAIITPIARKSKGEA